MGNRLASYLRSAQRSIYASSTPSEFRALVAMARIFHDTARIERRASRNVRAYSARDLTMAINSLIQREGIDRRLQADGLPPVPKVDWGKVIVRNSRKYVPKSMDQEDFVAELFTDMLAGKRVNTIRETGDWRNNIMGEIEAWAREGYDKARMEATLGKFTQNKAYNMLRTEMVRVNPDSGFESGEADPEALGKGRLFESLFTLDGITKDMMGNWMSMSRRNPVLTDLVRRIQDKLQKRDDDYAHIFSAYMQDPAATANELLEVTINGVDPKTGQRGRMPLWQALGFDEPLDTNTRNSNKVKFNNRLKNLRKILVGMYPEIESVLQDLQMR